MENTPGLAQAGIGQYDVKASPLQMALVAAAIANDGIIMKPYVTQSVHSTTGEMIEQIMPSVWKSALPSQIARSLKVAMKDIVENGTARRMMVSESAIGGKTGTAQKSVAGGYSRKKINSFVSVFPTSKPKFVLAIMLEEPKTNEDYIYHYRDGSNIKYKGTPFNTAGWTTVEVTSQIVERIGPILATKYSEIN